MKTKPFTPSALLRAFDIGEESAKVHFDWDDREGVLLKVEEEWGELKEAMKHQDPSMILEELGDLLFTLAQLARHVQLNPEEALTSSNNKFLHRFQKLKQLVQKHGKNLSELSQDEKVSYWKEIKKREQKSE